MTPVVQHAKLRSLSSVESVELYRNHAEAIWTDLDIRAITYPG